MTDAGNENNASLHEELMELCGKFGIFGKFMDCKLIEIGNINRTYKLTVESEEMRDGKPIIKQYIIQRVNMYVFKQPEQIMHNITLITKHIHDKIALQGRSTKRNAIRFYHLDNGSNYYFDGKEGFWRISRCVKDSITYNTVGDLDILRGAGHAFGEFQALLADFDATRLYETIPDFHNTPKRLKKLLEDAEADPVGRARDVKKELDFIGEQTELVSRLSGMLARGEVPLRVTHNDTKINNVLFDKNTNEPLVVVDLDTVMPGLAMYDYGDAVRSAANTADEDEPDLDKVHLNLDSFRAFTEGFISQTAHTLTKNELDSMALGVLTLTVELGARFLDDYLIGDKYFRIARPKHNIERARCQLRLAEDMLGKYDAMRDIISSVAAGAGGV